MRRLPEVLDASSRAWLVVAVLEGVGAIAFGVAAVVSTLYLLVLSAAWIIACDRSVARWRVAQHRRR